MATVCAVLQGRNASENVYRRRGIPRVSKAGLDDEKWEKEFTHKARHCLDAFHQASALVAELLYQIVTPPPAYTITTIPHSAEDDLPPPYCLTEELARAHVEHDALSTTARPASNTNHWDNDKSNTNNNNSPTTMSFQIDFGDTSGFQTRGKKAQKKKAQSVNFFDEDNGNKDNGAAEGNNNNSGSGDGNGANDGNADGAGGDGDGDGGGDDEGGNWNFGANNKKSKKSKKKQQEEEEEERKRKEEEEAAAGDSNDPLSWADNANGGGDDDWAEGFTNPKDKKKKKKGVENPPAVPDPPATSNFQDISLDDNIPKLDFSFDGASTKKTDSGFGSWGKTWDFGSIGADDKKKDTKESTTELGDNNPWSLGGNKAKKKTTIASDFDFGSFDTAGDVSFGAGDIGNAKTADDAWGFSSINKKDNKKGSASIEKKEDLPAISEAKKEDFTWGSWGPTTKTKKKDVTIEDPSSTKVEAESTTDSFGWSFGSKKDKKKTNLISDISEEPDTNLSTAADDAGDWTTSGWGTANKKKDKKGKQADPEDLTASTAAISNSEPAASSIADDIWTSFGAGKKDKKKNGMGTVSPPPAVPDPPSAVDNDIWTFGRKGKKGKDANTESSDLLEAVPGKDQDVVETKEDEPWDFGLTPKERRKKRKDMESQGIVFDAFGQPIYPEAEVSEEIELDPEPEPEPEDFKEPAQPWDFGLTPKEKRKKKKEMEQEGIRFDAFGEPIYPEPEPTTEPKMEPEIEAVPEPEAEPKQPWDFGLSPKERKKKRKEMEADGIKFDAFGEPIFPETEPASEPKAEDPVETTTAVESEVVPQDEPKQPWDFGLGPREKRKKRKEMEAEGIKFDVFGDPIYPEPEPAPLSESKTEEQPEVEIEAASVTAASTKEPEKPWDFGLNAKEKKKKKKEMQSQGILFDSFDQPIYPDPDPPLVTEPKIEATPEPEPIAEKEPPKPWDEGLTVKEKKKKKKEMMAQGVVFDAFDQPIYPDAEPVAEPAFEEPVVDVSEPAVNEASVKEPEQPWDFGLTPREKRKKRKEMQEQGILFDEFDQPIYPVSEEPDFPTKEAQPEIEAKVVEEKEPELPWDHGLNSKEKRKKRKEMEASGIEFDVFGQPIYSKAEDLMEEPLEEQEAEPVAEPALEIAKEPEQPWDFGLTPKERRKKRKDMEAEGIKFDTFGDPIYPEPTPPPEEEIKDVLPEPQPEPEVEPEAELEPEVPWDLGLSSKEKKKKKKEMEAQGIKFDTSGQPIYPKPAMEAKKTAAEPAENHEEALEEQDTWTTWDVSSKDKKKKADVDESKTLDLTNEQAQPKVSESKAKESDPWGAWGLTPKDKKKDPLSSKQIAETVVPAATSKANDAFAVWGITSKSKKTAGKDAGKDVNSDPAVSADVVSDAKAEKGESKANDLWGTWGLTSNEQKQQAEKDTKKKSLTSPVEEVPAEQPGADDDIWNTLTTTKDKKASKGTAKADKSAPAYKPSTADEIAVNDASLDFLNDDTWAAAGTSKAKVKKTPVEEKKKSSAWSFGTTTAAVAGTAAAAAVVVLKSKKDKDKEKDEDNFTADLLEEVVPTPKSASSKLTKTISRSAKEVDKNGVDDYFGDWGTGRTSTSKKTAGKKDTESKKEISKKGVTNEIDALMDLENDLEPSVDDKATTSIDAKSSKTMSSKTKVGTSISARIKSSEGDKVKNVNSVTKGKGADTVQDEIALDSAPTPKEEKKTSKTSVASKATLGSSKSSKSANNKRNEPEAPLSPLPGSFPGAVSETEDLLGDEEEEDLELELDAEVDPEIESEPEPEPEPVLPPSKSRSASKNKDGKKSARTSSKSVKTPVVEERLDDLLDLDSSKLPTPPSEEEKLPARKERARVERIGNTAGWGFWTAGPPPKKSASTPKKKESVSIPASAETKKTRSPQAFVRTKSARSNSEKDKEERKEASKSSGSDREATSKKSDRPGPQTGRGMSLSKFMLGSAPPSAMRSMPTRRPSVTTASRSSSRRASVDPVVTSPAADDEPPMSGKAARIMGSKGAVDRKRSVKDKSKAYVDPYPIDDDDMVMINAGAKRDLPAGTSRTPKKTTIPSRRPSTKPRSKTISGDEEMVMVDGPAGADAIFSGTEDVVRIDSPPRLARGNSVKKATGFFGSFFGGRKNVHEPTHFTDAEETALPIRTRSSSRRKSPRAFEEGELTTDAVGETDVDREARRAERRARREASRQAEDDERAERERRRRARREREQADLDARQARAKEQLRRQQEEEEREKEARRERRRQREAEKERLAQEELEMSAAADRRREERRRLRAQLETAGGGQVLSKADRQQSYDREEEERRRRKDRRRSRDPRGSSALVEEYHESRSGRGKGTAPPANKTSSWVDMQNQEPPEIPAVEGTILDPSGENPRRADDVDSGSRPRRDKYAGMTEAEIEEYRVKRRARRAAEKSNSGGSDERNKRRAARDYDAYGDPVKTFDGRPSLIRGDSKRSSFLNRFF